MCLSNSYNKIATIYDQENSSGIDSTTNDIAIAQLADFNWNEKKIIDFGVGAGQFLHALSQKFPQASLTGVDISRKMLEIAKAKMDLTTLCTSINDVEKYVPPREFDLILAHYVLAYIPLITLLQKAQHSLANNGYVSLITTTFDLFPHIQNVCSKNMDKKGLVSVMKKFFYQKAIQRSNVPKNKDELINEINRNHFKIVREQTSIQEINFKNAQEFTNWLIARGFLTEAIAMSGLPFFIFKILFKKASQSAFSFPFKDKLISEIMLLQTRS